MWHLKAILSVEGETFGGVAGHRGDPLSGCRASFDVSAGAVTSFLGGNGAGKTTTLRMILGLVHPSAGTAAIAGRPYRELEDRRERWARTSTRRASIPA